MDDRPSQTLTTSRTWFERLGNALLREPRDREQLIELLRDAQRRNLLDADALGMIESVLQVGEMQVRDIMIPRAQMVVVDRDASPEVILPVIIESGHSRFPVISDSRDEVVGILLAKDLLRFRFEGDVPFDIKDVMRPAVFIPESKRLNVLLNEFRASRNHLAIVVDEYGGVAGMVTIEDVLEQIVGEIEDEHDIDEDAFIRQRSENHYIIKALMPIEDFNAHFNADFSDEEFDTVGGLVTQAFGYMPKRGEGSASVVSNSRYCVPTIAACTSWRWPSCHPCPMQRRRPPKNDPPAGQASLVSLTRNPLPPDFRMSLIDPTHPMLRRLVLPAALALGAAMPFGFAPFGWFPLPVITLAALFLLLQNRAPASAGRIGLAFGLGMYGVGLSWIHISIHYYGGSPLPVAMGAAALLAVLMGLYPALLAYAVARLGVPGAVSLLLVLPAGWVLSEWLRGGLFTGLPWLNIGFTQIDGPLAGFAPLLGIYGMAWLVALSAGALAWTLVGRGPARGLGPLLLAGFWLAGAGLASIDWTRPAGAPLRVSLIQGNIPQDLKWAPEQQRATLEKYLDLTRPEWYAQGTHKSDLVVWPETAIPAFHHEVEAEFLAPLSHEARRAGSDLLTGIPVLDRERWLYYNAVIALGQEEGAYYKHHLVPFGEYLPLRKLLGSLLQVMPLPVADFSAGSLDQPLLQAAGYPVGVSICYEIVFGDQIITQLPQAAYLVNVSNDAWFGDSLAPHQHLEMARMRALETGRYLLRATNTGISAIIGPDGGVRVRSAQFETAVVRGEIEPRTGATPYVRWGDWPVIIAALCVFVAAGWWRGKAG
ncbi:MAG: apolipoprotein N-acyltransferase [Gammaproteobacteria bacterium]